jgi:hypothetical protein
VKSIIRRILKENNEDRMMDKIVDYMLEDTNWEVYVTDKYQHLVVYIIFPCDEGETYDKKSTDFWSGEFFTTPGDIKYIEDKFGITDEETIRELYNRYIVKLRPMILSDMDDYYSKQINESHVNNIDRFVDRVSQSLFNDTKYEVFRYRNEIRSKILYPFYPNVIRNNSEDHYRTFLKIIRVHGWEYGMTDEEYRYMRDTYDITDTNTILNIFLKYYILLYTNILEEMDKIRNNPLNNFK